jgi:FAD/FMN-containing dehydrogenase
MRRVDAAATAFGRRAPFLISVEATWESPAETERNIAWAKTGRDSLRRFSADGGLYLNFPGDGAGGESLVRAGYGDANYERLAALKATYDPTNVFRTNLNIAPVAAR